MTHTIQRRPQGVFVDTSGYFAIAYRADESHAPATRALDSLSLQQSRLFTTHFVLAELHALALSRTNARMALAFLTEIESNQFTTVVPVHKEDRQRARFILAQYDDRDYSLTDAVSFAVMERLDISVAFTFDRHFRQYGWQIVDGSEA